MVSPRAFVAVSSIVGVFATAALIIGIIALLQHYDFKDHGHDAEDIENFDVEMKTILEEGDVAEWLGDHVHLSTDVSDFTPAVLALLPNPSDYVTDYHYRPTYTGNLPYVFSDFNTLAQAIETGHDGPKNLWFDDDSTPVTTTGALTVVPKTFGNSVYNMKNVRWRASKLTIVTLNDGVYLNGLQWIAENIVIDYKGSSAPCMVWTNNPASPINHAASYLFLNHACGIQATGGFPFLQVVLANGDGFQAPTNVVLGSGCVLDGMAPVIDVTRTGGALGQTDRCVVQFEGSAVQVRPNTLGTSDGFGQILIAVNEPGGSLLQGTATGFPAFTAANFPTFASGPTFNVYNQAWTDAFIVLVDAARNRVVNMNLAGVPPVGLTSANGVMPGDVIVDMSTAPHRRWACHNATTPVWGPLDITYDFVFRDGYTGGSPHTFGDFNNMMRVIEASPGPKTIWFDDNTTPGVVSVPVKNFGTGGVYDMRDVKWRAHRLMIVTLGGNVLMQGLQWVEGIKIIHTGSVPAMVWGGGSANQAGNMFYMHNTGGIECTNAGVPFIRVLCSNGMGMAGFGGTGGGGFSVIMNTGSTMAVLNPGNAAIECSFDGGAALGANDRVLLTTIGPGWTMGPNCVSMNAATPGQLVIHFYDISGHPFHLSNFDFPGLTNAYWTTWPVGSPMASWQPFATSSPFYYVNFSHNNRKHYLPTGGPPTSGAAAGALLGDLLTDTTAGPPYITYRCNDITGGTPWVPI